MNLQAWDPGLSPFKAFQLLTLTSIPLWTLHSDISTDLSTLLIWYLLVPSIITHSSTYLFLKVISIIFKIPVLTVVSAR